MQNKSFKKWLLLTVGVAVTIIAVILIIVMQPTGGAAIVADWDAQMASAEVEPYARRAIAIIDEYLAFEITIDEAEEELRELCQRIDDLNIIGNLEHYNSADATISNAVLSLSVFADEFSDLDFRCYRDRLAFQIGEPVSGKEFPAEQKCYDDEEDCLCADVFGAYIKDAANYSCYQYEESMMLDITFDYANGVKINKISSVAGYIMDQLLEAQSFSHYGVSVSYQCYDQTIFTVGIDMRTNGVTYFICPSVELYNEEEWAEHYMQFSDFTLLLRELRKMENAFAL